MKTFQIVKKSFLYPEHQWFKISGVEKLLIMKLANSFSKICLNERVEKY